MLEAAAKEGAGVDAFDNAGEGTEDDEALGFGREAFIRLCIIQRESSVAFCWRLY